MPFRMFGFAILAVAVVAGASRPAVAAERLQPGEIILAQDDSQGSSFLRKIPVIRLLLGDRPPPEDNPEAPRKKKAGKTFDESYYDPKPVSPAPKKPAAPARTKPPAKPVQAVKAPISCEKATALVSGFGFSSVEAASCTGKVYAFNAQRDGKSFTIKLDPASGELTEVKKLP